MCVWAGGGAEGEQADFALRQADCTKHGAWCRVWSHDPKIMTWTETKSRMPNWLSHSGAPTWVSFDRFYIYMVRKGIRDNFCVCGLGNYVVHLTPRRKRLEEEQTWVGKSSVPFWTYKLRYSYCFFFFSSHRLSNKDIGYMNLESWERLGLEIYIWSNQHTDAI